METIAMYFLEQIEPVVIVEPIDGELQAFIDATDAAADEKFDAPSTFTFDYLIGSAHPPTHNDLWWRGYHAQRAGRVLASMPTESEEFGWFASYWRNGKYDANDDVEGEAHFIRTGGSGMGML